MTDSQPIRIATRGSALALVQANIVLDRCRSLFPDMGFELAIIKTTGDKLQTASMSNPDAALPKGLFTKEIEEALLDGSADLAVHSLKDLPTSLPDGLQLGAVLEREDVRDVLLFKSNADMPHEVFAQLANGATVATSSTRRRAQLLALRPDLNVVEIRGNVGTRIRKLKEDPDMAATILAAAGMKRLGFEISASGLVSGNDVPDGIQALPIELSEMLPCVGQAAIGIEIRENDVRIQSVCDSMNHDDTWTAVTAERAFLAAMGGGCQAPVGAHAQVEGEDVDLMVVSFMSSTAVRGRGQAPAAEAEQLGKQIAEEVGA